MRKRARILSSVVLMLCALSGMADQVRAHDCVPPEIELSVTSDDVVICQQITFDAGESEDPDGTELTYQWAFGDGETDTGEIVTHSYSCTGTGTWTVTLTVTDNDDPDCCGGQEGCQDKDKTKTTDITVSLPTGCSNAGQHDSSVNWINPDDDYSSSTQPASAFGSYKKAYATTYDVDFKYNSCTWVCEISNVEAQDRILVRYPFSLLPDNVSVESASDVPCDEAELAKFDLDDTDLTDDEGPPYCKYWCYTAIIAHEEKHRADWREFYGQKLSDAIATCESFLQVDIDCGNSDTITCQAAESSQESQIQSFFNLALFEAEDLFDDPDTPLDETEQRAYEMQYEFDHPISAALPEGCTP